MCQQPASTGRQRMDIMFNNRFGGDWPPVCNAPSRGETANQPGPCLMKTAGWPMAGQLARQAAGMVLCQAMSSQAEDHDESNAASFSAAESEILFSAYRDGDRAALDALIGRLNRELRRLARTQLTRERRDHSLCSGELVNEAYLLLIPQRNVQNRAHFVAIAARLMRRILLNHARDRRAKKRGGGDVKVPLDEALDAVRSGASDVVDTLTVHQALERLEELDPRQARVVELKVFGDLKRTEIASLLEVSEGTVKRDWSLARAWLRRELDSSD